MTTEFENLVTDAHREALAVIAAKHIDSDAVETLRREWLGKTGKIKLLLAQLRSVEPDDRPRIAALLNTTREALESYFVAEDARAAAGTRTKALESLFVDLSLPAKAAGLGGIHPITQIERVIAELLRECGFTIVDGPEIETEYFCFDSLNIPAHHPARDLQDTFYTENGRVLRTHTTSVQARVLKEGKAPVQIASFGRAYRNETEDASHQAMFHQFELVWLDKGLTLSHLMGLITHIVKELYGKRRRVKFVPKFYPYTEPSIGVLIDNVASSNVASKSADTDLGDGEWVTVAGAGMIHPKVLQEFGFDPDNVSGFAFGLGTARLAAQFFGFADIRSLYENDLRVLKGLRG